MTDKQLIRYATQFRRGIIGDNFSGQWCFAICAPLLPMLEMCGVAGELVEGDWGHGNHFWIGLPDGRVLDPTADQFNAFEGFATMPPVYLGPPTAIHGIEPIPGSGLRCGA